MVNKLYSVGKCNEFTLLNKIFKLLFQLPLMYFVNAEE